MAITVADNDGNLTIEIVEYEEDVRDANDERPIRKRIEFLVSREVLVKSSQYFTILLCSTKYGEANKDFITLHDNRAASMAIWFRVLHGIEPDYDVELDEMWHLAAACDKYQFEITKLKDWFAKWYQKQPIEHWLRKQAPNPRSLLYPCWVFDHPLGFMRVTKFLAYNCTGHITEHNPTKFYNLHLPPRVIQQMNAAKGRLRTIIHNGLFEPNDKLLQATCTCKEVTLFNYEKALYNIKVWPLERTAQTTTMTEILEKLNGFRCEPKENACGNCRSDYQSTVKLAQKRTREYFDGLCLDCMNKNKAKTGDEDEDYWQHVDFRNQDYSRYCRKSHGEPTWYFSFMGRKEDIDRFLREKQKRRYEEDFE